MMKKLLGLLLALSLLAGCATVLAEDEWVNFHCDQEGFSTKISVNGSAGYIDQRGMVGLQSFLGVPGYPPYVLAHRRAADRKFSNPQNYLNNVYREFLENKYENDSLGMNPAKIWEVGGKQLIGARYMYRAGGITLNQVQLIEQRELGDVEYTALYAAEDEEKVMAALNVLVENYLEDEAAGTDSIEAPVDQPAEKPAAAGKLLEPVDDAGQPVDLENGTFWTDLTMLNAIDQGGFFYAQLYKEDCYPAAEVESLQPGDQVKLEGVVYTVQAFQRDPDRDDLYTLTTVEENNNYYRFVKVNDQYPDRDNYHVLNGNDAVVHFCTDYQVMLPLPYAFQFAWVDGEDVQLRDADDFIRLLREGILPEEEMTHNLTAIQFRDGLVTAIVHAEY